MKRLGLEREIVERTTYDRAVARFRESLAAYRNAGKDGHPYAAMTRARLGRLLLQQRAEGKRLWPLYWSNSCCSHPRRGESIEIAAARRLQDELHTTAELEFVYKFRYQARFGELGSEHELCHVLLGRLEDEPRANATEIAALRRVTAAELDREFRDRSEAFTPWFRMEWQRLKDEFATTLARYTNPV